MEAAGLAIGIVGLYTTCRDCYSFFTTVMTAETAASTHLRELQPGLIHTNQKRTKLHEYLLGNRFKAEGVFNTLSALADTLSNQEKLIKRYGIQLHPTRTIQDTSQLTNNVGLSLQDLTIEDINPVVNEVKSRLSMLNRFKWALKDRNDFRALISDLRCHSESLYCLCPDTAFGSMNIYLTMDCLARQESPAALKWISRIAAEHAVVDQRSSVREGYELLASAATLKASVNENRSKGPADDSLTASVDQLQPEMNYLGKSLALFEDEVVYVEMRDYRGPPPDLTPEQKNKNKRQRRRKDFLKSLSANLMASHHLVQAKALLDGVPGDVSSDEGDNEPIKPVRPVDPMLRALIKNFYNIFQGEGAMKSVYGLNIAGMIDHTDGEHRGHCSILYRLPNTIGLQSRERPVENLKLRAPVTLKSLLGTKHLQGIRSTLGARFELARNIVQAVCLLHSSGWLHKNIRADMNGRDMVNRLTVTEEIKDIKVSGFTLDYYQHPAKHANPKLLKMKTIMSAVAGFVESI
ncbi:hypothetical protein D7B24_002744 [Verticillium nonalfalfae]|uniref:Prion-inhibition and propagation HeLo domain-containing protein n=1 Tax=Verticillium nonalfalfae TaxID=1051616 RepID=A0A3M9YHW9_9PEZI|nr:uncharacterized protein D7B24_002744 [Verticillium nonalfalfae]RNJ59366.1 hypothetical protein D7B24_002744 [Verticillium nonalfalfae]